MIEKRGRFVYKTNETLTLEWKEKFMAIMDYMYFPAFVRFIPGGYVTEFINGVDLQEDIPFNYRHDIVRAYPLTNFQRQKIIEILKDILNAGIKTGYYLGDFTKRNIIMEVRQPFLIDYDVIIEEFNEDYIRIYQTMLDYLKIDYKFDGDPVKLYEYLS